MAGSAAGGAGIPDADFKQAMDLMDKMATIADTDKANCDKMADDLKKLFTDNKDMMEKMNAMKKSGVQPSADQMEKLKGTATKMMGPMMSCGSNPKMQETMKAMGGM
jgi:hypothetical protein